EICHADASEPHRYAAREQFAEHFFGSGEQFPLVIGWFDQTHRLVRRKIVDVTEAQAQGARLLAVFAQGRADALAEILDQPAKKASSSPGATMRKPRGRSSREAIEATTLVRAAPSETLSPVSLKTSICNRTSVPR